jgi:hypothetical protein
MKVLRPLKAIRHKCLDCCGGSYTEVDNCPCTQCTLWPYRMGKRPASADAEDETPHERGE